MNKQQHTLLLITLALALTSATIAVFTLKQTRATYKILEKSTSRGFSSWNNESDVYIITKDANGAIKEAQGPTRRHIRIYVKNQLKSYTEVRKFIDDAITNSTPLPIDFIDSFQKFHSSPKNSPWTIRIGADANQDPNQNGNFIEIMREP